MITSGRAMTAAAAIDQWPLGLVARLEALERDRQRIELRVPEVDQRAEEVAPLLDEGEQRDRDEGRPRQRDDDPPAGSQLARAVDPGGVRQLIRDGPEELAQQEDEERIAQERRDQQGQVGPDPAELAERHVQRDERDLGRQHHRREQDQEDDVASGPSDPGEPVRHEAARHDGPDDRRDGIEEAVAEREREVDAASAPSG